MDVYLCLFVASFVGLSLLAIIGGAGHQVHRTAPHAGHHGGVGHASVKAPRPSGNSHESFAWLQWVSPFLLLGLLFGFGASGLLLRPWLGGGWLLLVAAVIGALLCQFVVLQPFWKFLLGFASKPARTLDSAVLADACAVTNFDAKGHGLVRLEIDGQTHQILATIAPDERQGARVLAGTPLYVRSVDSFRQRCVVSRAAGGP